MAILTADTKSPKLMDLDVVNFYQSGAEKGVTKKYPSLDLVRLEHLYFNHQPGHLLEYACGPGANAVHLLECGHRVDAIDAAPGCVDMLRDRVADRTDINQNLDLKVLEPNSIQLPYDDDAFDYVVCMSVLSLLVTRERIKLLIGEFRRVLKAGGKAIFDINGPKSGFASHAKLIADNCYEYTRPGGIIRCYCPPTPADFAALIEPCLEIDDVGQSSHSFFDVSEQEFIICAHKA